MTLVRFDRVGCGLRQDGQSPGEAGCHRGDAEGLAQVVGVGVASGDLRQGVKGDGLGAVGLRVVPIDVGGLVLGCLGIGDRPALDDERLLVGEGDQNIPDDSTGVGIRDERETADPVVASSTVLFRENEAGVPCCTCVLVVLLGEIEVDVAQPP